MPQTYTLLPDSTATCIPAEPSAFVCTWSNQDAGAAWVRAVGELDLAAVAQLTEALHDAQHRARLVVLDLRELTFLDSAGVHAIADASIDARRKGRRLLLLRAPDRVQRAFELTGTCNDVEAL